MESYDSKNADDDSSWDTVQENDVVGEVIKPIVQPRNAWWSFQRVKKDDKHPVYDTLPYADETPLISESQELPPLVPQLVDNSEDKITEKTASERSGDAQLSDKVQVRSTCKVATTESIDLSDSNIMIDGTNLMLGDRVLIKDQTNSVDNGIYVVSEDGSFARAQDFANGLQYDSSVVTFVQSGSENGGVNFACTTEKGIVGSDPNDWTRESSEEHPPLEYVDDQIINEPAESFCGTLSCPYEAYASSEVQPSVYDRIAHNLLTDMWFWTTDIILSVSVISVLSCFSNLLYQSDT